MGGGHRGDDLVWLDAVIRPCRLLIIVLLSGLLACSEAPESVQARRFSRLVSLAPNLTELVFAAGAGDSLVGRSAYSDYPPEALALPVVGDAFTVDQEQLALLAPDALLVWQNGTPTGVIDNLRRGGYHVEVIRTLNLDDVAAALAHIGELTGHDADANRAVTDYLGGLQALRERYSGKPPVRVFYQVSQRPLFTINGDHYVSKLIEVCGGRNIFADLDDLAPTVDVEAVVDRDPEVMLASDEAGADTFAEWDRWPNIAANRYRNRFLMPADEIGRATPRLLVAGQELCKALDEARARRAAA